MSRLTEFEFGRVAGRSQEEAARCKGVTCLAYQTFEADARYHAIGVYSVDGQIRARSWTTDWASKVPDARDLYLTDPWRLEDERANAAGISARFTGLAPELAALLEKVAKPGTENTK